MRRSTRWPGGQGPLNGDKANRLKALITGSVTKEAFADADFVIEAVFEDMKVKQQVFAESRPSFARTVSWPPTPPRCR
jgi:3-hydroxyacyl-CoA dehydrogenase